MDAFSIFIHSVAEEILKWTFLCFATTPCMIIYLKNIGEILLIWNFAMGTNILVFWLNLESFVKIRNSFTHSEATFLLGELSAEKKAKKRCQQIQNLLQIIEHLVCGNKISPDWHCNHFGQALQLCIVKKTCSFPINKKIQMSKMLQNFRYIHTDRIKIKPKRAKIEKSR